MRHRLVDPDCTACVTNNWCWCDNPKQLALSLREISRGIIWGHGPIPGHDGDYYTLELDLT